MHLNNVQSAGLSPPLCGVSQVCDLLDLLGGSEQPLQPSPALGSTAPPIPVSTPNTVGGDLLDLLGGLEPTPITPGLTFTYTHNELQKQETGIFRHTARELVESGHWIISGMSR